MLRRRFAAVVVFALASLIGCNDSSPQEAVTKDLTAKLQELATTLQSVKDEVSAKAANEKLKAIAVEIKRLKDQSEKLPTATAEQDQKIHEKYGKDAEATLRTITTETKRIELNPKLAGPIAPAMEQLGRVMK
jgi:predicted nuclease with TOPRIM domain